MFEFREWLLFERQLCLTVDKGTSIVFLEDKKSMEEADNMASFCILDEFEVHKNKKFLEIAEELKPELYEKKIFPEKLLELEKEGHQEPVIKYEENIDKLSEKALKKNDVAVLDFGNHNVGYVTLDLASVGSHQDAPAYIYTKFAERLDELAADTENYNGWISKGWIQEEYIHVDILPAKIRLPRRYAFRYMEIRVIDVSLKFSLVVKNVTASVVSAVKEEMVQPIVSENPLLEKIDKVSVRTLQNCMQLVFEDGPKRDRRMWLGDLRLQARANYKTFHNIDLVKRCLYLFGGLTFNEGKIPACLFLEPEIEPDDTYLFDYALLYGSVLVDYYEETKDRKTLEDLYPVAIRQIEIGIDYLNEEGIVPDHSGEFWCFVDWGDGLNTQAASLAILIYSMRYGIRLAEHMDDKKTADFLNAKMQKLKKTAVEHFWDEEQQLFVSGDERQISWATQVWMILARVFDKEKNRKLILHTIEVNPRIRMVTPYMYHHYIDALIRSDEKQRALDEMIRYWGEMIHDGADTFWEVYNPYNKFESPYGSVAVNSFCHAWSCTPTYFLRKFYTKNDK